MDNTNVFVKSEVHPIKMLFLEKFDVDFYQREYVWEKKQIEDLVEDLTIEFLKNWTEGDALPKVSEYSPYYMGEIVLSEKGGTRSAIIDGQQRITTVTLLLIYLQRRFGSVKGFPADISKLIYDDYFGQQLFNLDIEERKPCMLSLYETGTYNVKDTDPISVRNLVDRYQDIDECWRTDDINETNIVPFMYWLKEKVMFSKVWTNSDDFAYVIFETMNDRGLSLTQVEMLRSYMLANIAVEKRDQVMKEFDGIIKRLAAINLSSKSKAEFEFFKIYFRSHYAQNMSTAKNVGSDFVKIGKEFHRWVRDESEELGLKASSDYIDFMDKIMFFAKTYIHIMDLIENRNVNEYLYLIVNSDYGFTLQPALIMAAISYNDTTDTINEKIKVVTKYLTKVLSWRIWNHWLISQNQMETKIYELCKQIRDMSLEDLKAYLETYQMDENSLDGNSPRLNQQNRPKIKVLLALVTEIVAKESGTSDYMLNKKEIEVEHIWANHFEQHTDEFDNESDFATARNNIGDLLVLPKSFNASYGDATYDVKVKQYFSQNILAQTLNPQKYENNPGFLSYVNNSGLPFKSYEVFKKASIDERTDLYRKILEYEFKEFKG
ncbi:DUF262 domain-containing protein [Butyrivibrio sp. VCB2006]|uniref:DUF262 domain-containing protein n=1 Tax=Butyrivibrio sp. VCB2006 TaxID=1280679 RepID=UPI0003FFB5D3|nr:DUF262 domain-containing protein [Butyrivibrio sp. VCB2006]